MFTWNDYEVAKEQHQDRLRRQEKQRLIKEIEAKSDQPSLWQSLSHKVVGRQSPNRSGRYRAAEESA